MALMVRSPPPPSATRGVKRDASREHCRHRAGAPLLVAPRTRAAPHCARRKAQGCRRRRRRLGAYSAAEAFDLRSSTLSVTDDLISSTLAVAFSTAAEILSWSSILAEMP